MASNSRKLVLVLGAGVSIGCGLPDWNTLFKKLRKNIHFNNSDRERSLVIEKIFLKLFNRTDLILARNIHQCFGFEPEINDSIIFEKFVRCALYDGIKLKYTKSIEEIVRLGSFYRYEKYLDSIITYNYDDVLESFFEERPGTPYKSIFHSEIEFKDQLPIYHVHGFLPRKDDLTVKNKIILSEEKKYHDLYDSIDSWNNKIQLEKFENNICLLIGLSLNDPNLRRLLDTAVLSN